MIIIMNAICNDRAKADFDEHIAVTDDWDEFCSSLDKKMVSFVADASSCQPLSMS